jgi:transposase
VPALLDDPQHPVPVRLKGVVMRLHRQIQQLNDEIKDIKSDLKQQLKEADAGRRLKSIPGIGPITASAVLANVGDVSNYRNGRDFAASLGLVPRQYSTGGKTVLQGISKHGDKYIRQLLVQGARSIMQHIDNRDDALGPWVRELLKRRHSNVVASALANKLARVVWAVLAKGGQYDPHPDV